jgi:hypothetical protein
MNDLPVDQISTSSVSINGARGNQNEFLLDGAPNTAAAQNQPIIYADPDAVQEFKVETNAYSAEYGRAAGGVFNVVTKNGTNDLHFTLYEFLRNDAINANDWFANRGGQSPPPLKFNQFGGTLGGPRVDPARLPRPQPDVLLRERRIRALRPGHNLHSQRAAAGRAFGRLLPDVERLRPTHRDL